MLGIQKAGKGVFITTSTFTPQAKEFVEKSPQKIILIDREMLAELMIDYGVGLYNKTTYTLKDIDLDYFEGE